MSTVIRNCSADCAEHLGGHCAGEDCPYRPTTSVPAIGEPASGKGIEIPSALDDAIYNALRGVIGSDLAFAAVDAVGEALLETGRIVDLGFLHARPALVFELGEVAA